MEVDGTGKLVEPGGTAGVVKPEDAGKRGGAEKFELDEHALEFVYVMRTSLFALDLTIPRIRFLNILATSTAGLSALLLEQIPGNTDANQNIMHD